jgi:hypothetical protein
VEGFPLQVLTYETRIDQLVAQVFRERAGIALIVHDMRRDQYQQLGAGS